jgi:Domain of unknown function (DUF6484)
MQSTIQKQGRTAWRTAKMPGLGLLVDIGADGSPIIEQNDNGLGPIPARTAITSARLGDTVLLIFDQGDPTRPIIIGVVRDTFAPSRPQRLRIAANEIVVEGTEEVSLRCGESSLTLRKDGKTVLKGREVLTRASQTNRIKGSTVQIN